jgi:hypothetical protein
MAENPETGEMESVVNFETVEIKITIPKELYRLLLQAGAALGMPRSQIIITALAKYVVDSLATNIILAHNHPSGNLKPSEADKELTNKIKKASEYMDIKLLDHLIIVPEGKYLSFREDSLL